MVNWSDLMKREGDGLATLHIRARPHGPANTQRRGLAVGLVMMCVVMLVMAAVVRRLLLMLLLLLLLLQLLAASRNNHGWLVLVVR
jgi:hypothetical protein